MVEHRVRTVVCRAVVVALVSEHRPSRDSSKHVGAADFAPCKREVTSMLQTVQRALGKLRAPAVTAHPAAKPKVSWVARSPCVDPAGHVIMGPSEASSALSFVSNGIHDSTPRDS